ncbi:MAG: NAD(P)H dehydrogenase [Verrucomicrobia bacterium A1]|nr:MAG: NAD(P)H dehydrogenase [Verrucomicrobia bacterium A1]
MAKRILGIVGSYRKGGVIDTLVTETLAAAAEQGARTSKIYLLDQRIEFCANCRVCTQKPGPEPGNCVQKDDMAAILAEYRDADAVVIGAPVNFYNVNALTRKFMERLVCCAYWPWGAHGPRMRVKNPSKPAVLISSMAMPTILGRLFNGVPRALKLIATTLGAKPVGTILVGMIAQREHPAVPAKALQRARDAGRILATA